MLPLPPPDLQTINETVNQAVHYRDYAEWDFTPLPAEGNCVSIAYSKFLLLKPRYGDRIHLATCMVGEQTMHAFVVVDNTWFLDYNRAAPKGRDEMNCKGTIWSADAKLPKKARK